MERQKDHSAATLWSTNPRSGETLRRFMASTAAEVNDAVQCASAVAPVLAHTSPKERASWLHAISASLSEREEEILKVAGLESGLPVQRLDFEFKILLRQWRFYADVVAAGGWLRAKIEKSTKERSALRSVGTPIGPVAVFGASNFPLGFGSAGHDTAAVIGSGNPVLIKAHPAHPWLSEILIHEIKRGLQLATAPENVAQSVSGFEAGALLASHPGVKAVAFTGSERGGLALRNIALAREVPIPVFAEMGTVNPVIVAPTVSPQFAQELATSFLTSIQYGAGQVCTKPGLIFVPAGSGFAGAVISQSAKFGPAGWALTEGIAHSYLHGIDRIRSAGAQQIVSIRSEPRGSSFETLIFKAAIDQLEPGSPLTEECFGPVGIVVEYENTTQLIQALKRMQGALAASVFTEAEHDPDVPALLEALSSFVGRIVVNEWPMAAPARWAQHHGGPWPSTTEPTATSVGASSLDRFVRPIAFQNVPNRYLPEALKDENPWGIQRQVDGEWLPSCKQTEAEGN